MKFEVGERVQVIADSQIRVGTITEGLDDLKDGQMEVDLGDIYYYAQEEDIAKLDQPKQSEKVKKINEIMLELIHRKDLDILSDDDITRMLIEALDIVNTLDEPESVAVPKFVADWLEEHKESPDLVENYTEKDALANTIHFTIYCLFADFPNTNPDVELRKPVCEWLEEDRSNYFKLIDAVRNGYVVEEAKNWIVSIEYHDGQYDVRYFHSFAGRTSKEDFPSVVSVKKRAYRFTEKEKADAVAVLINGTVEEVEAE